MPGEFPLEVRTDIKILKCILLNGLIAAILPYSPELIGEIAMRGIEIQDVPFFRKIDRSVNGLDILLPFGKNTNGLNRRYTRETIITRGGFKGQGARQAIGPTCLRCPEQGRDHQVVDLTRGVWPELCRQQHRKTKGKYEEFHAMTDSVFFRSENLIYCSFA